MQLHRRLQSLIGCETIEKTFPFFTKNMDFSLFYDDNVEALRMGINRFRITKINKKYKICRSYPEVLIVPSSITDEEIHLMKEFRAQNRIPVMSWRSSTNDASLWRCSQPKTGLTQANNIYDEKMVGAIAGRCPMLILDARPKIAAMANLAAGAGWECSDGYRPCKVEWADIQNIHQIRNSWNAAMSSVKNVDHDSFGGKWWSQLESSHWYDHVGSLLAATKRITNELSEGRPVLTHCSEGWDRTSQLCALSMICVDQYYRTTHGFLTVIAREFLSFGHKFHTRLGLPGNLSEEEEVEDKTTTSNTSGLFTFGQNNKAAVTTTASGGSESSRSPIFIEFLDCVYQLQRQNICNFEFNEDLLLYLANEIYFCRFGNFLCDNPQQRKQLNLVNRTKCIFKDIITRKNDYRNILYFKPLENEESIILQCRSELPLLHPWISYWFRYHPIGATLKSSKSNELLQKLISNS
eukprot:GHVL01033764.1.p1 GENE.GHVL01033764.1~~GHVL01033764.1.p1  ORF type:complete len:466 (+),score=74.97 GHVL01033764.1:531-1928(+)